MKKTKKKNLKLNNTLKNKNNLEGGMLKRLYGIKKSATPKSRNSKSAKQELATQNSPVLTKTEKANNRDGVMVKVIKGEYINKIGFLRIDYKKNLYYVDFGNHKFEISNQDELLDEVEFDIDYTQKLGEIMKKETENLIKPELNNELLIANDIVSGSSEDKKHSRLVRNLKIYNYEILQVPPDNNCQFHALADQLNICMHPDVDSNSKEPHTYPINHIKLREQASDWLIENITTEFNNTNLQQFIGINTELEYKNIMDQYKLVDKTWGDEYTLIAISHIYNAAIHIISNIQQKRETDDVYNKKSILKTIISPFLNKKEVNCNLVLGHYEEVHYTSTRRLIREDESKPTKGTSKKGLKFPELAAPSAAAPAKPPPAEPPAKPPEEPPAEPPPAPKLSATPGPAAPELSAALELPASAAAPVKPAPAPAKPPPAKPPPAPAKPPPAVPVPSAAAPSPAQAALPAQAAALAPSAKPPPAVPVPSAVPSPAKPALATEGPPPAEPPTALISRGPAPQAAATQSRGLAPQAAAAPSPSKPAATSQPAKPPPAAPSASAAATSRRPASASLAAAPSATKPAPSAAAPSAAPESAEFKNNLSDFFNGIFDRLQKHLPPPAAPSAAAPSAAAPSAAAISRGKPPEKPPEKPPVKPPQSAPVPSAAAPSAAATSREPRSAAPPAPKPSAAATSREPTSAAAPSAVAPSAAATSRGPAQASPAETSRGKAQSTVPAPSPAPPPPPALSRQPTSAAVARLAAPASEASKEEFAKEEKSSYNLLPTIGLIGLGTSLFIAFLN